MSLVVIETPRLQLLAPRAEHLESLNAVFGSEPAMQFIGDGSAWPEDRVRRLLDAMIELQQARGFSLWPVRRRDTGEVIGDCGLCLIRHSGTDEPGPEVELGYHLQPNQWGKGFATEAATASLRYALDELALEEVIAVTQPDNVASQRVLLKAGMTRASETERYYDRTLRLFRSVH